MLCLHFEAESFSSSLDAKYTKLKKCRFCVRNSSINESAVSAARGQIPMPAGINRRWQDTWPPSSILRYLFKCQRTRLLKKATDSWMKRSRGAYLCGFSWFSWSWFSETRRLVRKPLQFVGIWVIYVTNTEGKDYSSSLFDLRSWSKSATFRFSKIPKSANFKIKLRAKCKSWADQRHMIWNVSIRSIWICKDIWTTLLHFSIYAIEITNLCYFPTEIYTSSFQITDCGNVMSIPPLRFFWRYTPI